MTRTILPKERAEQLFDKMYNVIPKVDDRNVYEKDCNVARVCAMACVTEILHELDGAGQKLRHNYYLEVERELELKWLSELKWQAK